MVYPSWTNLQAKRNHWITKHCSNSSCKRSCLVCVSAGPNFFITFCSSGSTHQSELWLGQHHQSNAQFSTLWNRRVALLCVVGSPCSHDTIKSVWKILTLTFVSDPIRVCITYVCLSVYVCVYIYIYVRVYIYIYTGYMIWSNTLKLMPAMKLALEQ